MTPRLFIVIPCYNEEAVLPITAPMFLEKRVYQGSSGKVYPLPVIDRILDEKEDKPYTAATVDVYTANNDNGRVLNVAQDIYDCDNDGSFTASMPVEGKMYFLYRL